jgi:hypothetical protein
MNERETEVYKWGESSAYADIMFALTEDNRFKIADDVPLNTAAEIADAIAALVQRERDEARAGNLTDDEKAQDAASYTAALDREFARRKEVT